ncbi:MAG: penicillin-binding protein activator, partial [Gammaproteobacteria bacterium]|nr:penicillin-binding protein activator [Gammaproteobacteria bacterium]
MCRIVAILIISLLLVNCASGPQSDRLAVRKQQTEQATSESLKGSSLDDAKGLEEKGDHVEAAKVYGKLSQNTDKTPEERTHFKLKAAHALASGGFSNQARLVLNDIDIARLNKNLLQNYFFVRAKIALAERNADDAQDWLKKVRLPVNAPISIHAEFLYARIRMHELTGNIPGIVNDRIELSPLLADDEQKLANQAAIIGVLSMLSISQIETLLQKEKRAGADFKGWLSLAIILQESHGPNRLARLVQQWRTKFPKHPISENLLASIVPQQTAETRPPDLHNIALLLPFEGPFAKPAQAVRDGFLAAYYAQKFAEGKPKIRIYDTGADPSKITEIYKKALDEGASIIVGPLNKDAVETLIKKGGLTVPTIALNRVNDGKLFTDNLYQFGLSPEDEAQQVADRAWHDGHNRAAVFYPNTNWG